MRRGRRGEPAEPRAIRASAVVVGVAVHVLAQAIVPTPKWRSHCVAPHLTAFPRWRVYAHEHACVRVRYRVRTATACKMPACCAAHYRWEAELATACRVRGNAWQRRCIAFEALGCCDGCRLGYRLAEH